MTEILTESFCERCGTRYTFESARPRVRLKGVKVLSRGLKNFVMSDDSSIDEAMAAARSDTDRELTAHQLDAFHKTFNFCMSCRQYTCPNCWNEAEARCLSCAPHLGQEVMAAPFPDLVTSSYLVADPVDAAVTNGTNGHDIDAENASTSGVDTADFAARLQALMAPPAPESAAQDVAETVVAAKVVDEVIEDSPVEALVDEVAVAEPEPQTAEPVEAAVKGDEPVAAEEAVEIDEPVAAERVAAEPVASKPVGAEPVPEVEAADVAIVAEGATESDGSGEAAEIAARLAAWGAAAAAMDAADEEPDAATRGAAQTGSLLRRFRAGQSLDAELDAYEQDQTTTPAAAGSDPGAVAAEAVIASAALAADEPEVEAEAEAETVASESEAVAAVAAEPAAEPVPSPAPEPVDLIQQPTWRMVAPDPTIERPATPPISPSIPAAAIAPDPNAEPQWPTRPGGAPSAGLPFLNRPAAATGGLEALWAESARDVVTPPTVSGRPVATGGVQPCVSCGLSLSATARFCRRCGTPQAL
jgi:hypothetical protein